MLASTVQFSSYGRSRPRTRRLSRGSGWFIVRSVHTGRAGAVKVGHEAPDPSGPNSVPGHLLHALLVPTGEPDVLAERMSRRPTSRRSTLEQPPWIERPGRGSGRRRTGARCSLERR